MTVTSEIRKTFNTYADAYAKAAVIQHEIGLRLLDRLSYLKLQPRRILDLGCGPGVFLQKLRQLYPDAYIVGVDLAEHMLSQAKQIDSGITYALVQADMDHLPFAAETFDLIFANQVIHWSPALVSVLQALNMVLAREGCLMFTTLGPDTFHELRHAFAMSDSYAHVNKFMDMHDIGDILLQLGFVDSVVDMEELTANYATLAKLLRSLKTQGVKNIHPDRRMGLMGKHTWAKFVEHMCIDSNAKYPLTYEVIYGHAWKNTVQTAKSGTKTFVSMERMRTLLGETCD